MKFSRFIIIFLLSLTLISLEIVWTRIFSAEYFYTFAFLTLSLAILGLGLGALTFRMIPFINKKNTLGIMLILSAIFALAGPSIVLSSKLDFAKLLTSWEMIAKFVLAVFLLSAPFFTGGIALAKLFRENVEDMPDLYMADLLGAGFGGVVAITFMNVFSTHWAAFLIVIPMILAAFFAEGKLKYAVVIPLIATFVLLNYSGVLLDPPRKERAPLMHWYWDSMAKIKIFDYGKEARGLNIDNVAHTTAYAFDGDWTKFDTVENYFGLPFEKLMAQNQDCKVMIMGAGGGREVLQALAAKACEVHAVEVNPKINYLLTDGELADFSGNIYQDPRVKVVTDDARAYVRKFENEFDLITSFSSNTFAALASGSFALSENYLFTTEAFMDYYKALSENGFIFMEHQFYIPKVAAEVIDGLTRLGIENPKEHFAVYNLPGMKRNLIVIGKKPLTKEIINEGIIPIIPENHNDIHLLYPCDDSLKGNIVNRVVNDGWETVMQNSDIDIAPCDDDKPFVAQMGLMKNFEFAKLKELTPYEFRGFPVSKLVVTAILLIVIILVLPLMLIPYLKKGEKLKAAPWLYFFSIGIAFMVVEIILIQRYTLFIGASSYSFVTILLTILIASGIGSKFSEKFDNKFPFMAIAFLILMEIFVFRSVTSLLVSWDQIPRIIVSIILVSPLGFFMGMPFPKAAKRVGDLIDWGFAVNGVASVIGSTAIILIVINFGFSLGLLAGVIFYLSAMFLMNSKLAWR